MDHNCKSVTGLRQYEGNCWFAATLFALFYPKDAFIIFSRYLLFRDDLGKDNRKLKLMEDMQKIVATMLREDSNLLEKKEWEKLEGTTKNLYKYITDYENKYIKEINSLLTSRKYTPRFTDGDIYKGGSGKSFLDFMFTLYDVPKCIIFNEGHINHDYFIYLNDISNYDIKSIIKFNKILINDSSEFIIFVLKKCENIYPNYMISIKNIAANTRYDTKSEFFLNSIIVSSDVHLVSYILCNGHIYLMDSDNAQYGIPIRSFGKYVDYDVFNSFHNFKYNFSTTEYKSGSGIIYIYVKSFKQPKVPEYFKCLLCTDINKCENCKNLQKSNIPNNFDEGLLKLNIQIHEILKKKQSTKINKKENFDYEFAKQNNPILELSPIKDIREHNENILLRYYRDKIITELNRAINGDKKYMNKFIMVTTIEDTFKSKNNSAYYVDIILREYNGIPVTDIYNYDIKLIYERYVLEQFTTAKNIYFINSPDIDFNIPNNIKYRNIDYKFTFLTYGSYHLFDFLDKDKLNTSNILEIMDDDSIKSKNNKIINIRSKLRPKSKLEFFTKFENTESSKSKSTSGPTFESIYGSNSEIKSEPKSWPTLGPGSVPTFGSIYESSPETTSGPGSVPTFGSIYESSPETTSGPISRPTSNQTGGIYHTYISHKEKYNKLFSMKI